MPSVEKWYGKTALITGASSGIGAEFARLLARAGCNLIITARRLELLEELREEILGRHDVSVDVIDQDLAKPDGVRSLLFKIDFVRHPVDVLINNAGFGKSGDFQDTDWASEKRMIQLNVTSLVELTKAILPAMVEKDAGHILLMASVLGYFPLPQMEVYNATKAFVASFGETLAFDLRHSNVGVTVLSPGQTETEFLEISGFELNRAASLTLLSARRVALCGIHAMEGRKPSVIVGLLNRIIVWSRRILPMRLRYWITEKVVNWANPKPKGIVDQ